MAFEDDRIRHLLLSFPESGGAERTETLKRLVLRAAVDVLESGKTNPLSVEEVSRHLKDSLGLAFDSDEVRRLLEALQADGAVAFTDRDRHSVAVSQDAVTELRHEAAARTALEVEVRDEWASEYRATDDSIEEEVVSAVWQGVRSTLAKAINDRAAEAAAFLYADREEARLKFEEGINRRRGSPDLDELPEAIRQEVTAELSEFFGSPSDLRRRFLVNLLSASFRYHLVSLDPHAARLAESVLEGKTFYLDTNFLFKLLALHGPREARAPGLLVEAAERVNSRMVVTRATLEEFKSSIRSQGQRLKRNWLEREDFQRIAAQEGANDLDFMAQFYRELREGKVSGPDQFQNKYMQIEQTVLEWGIEIDETLEFETELTEEQQDRVSQLAAWTSPTRAASACRHDILLEAHVLSSRKKRFGGPNDIDVWFLTYDRTFTRFVYSRHENGGLLPAPLLAEDWLQVVRQFSPRTDDFDHAFLSMVSQPILAEDRSLPFETVVNALARLEQFEEVSPGVAAGMIADTEFLTQFDALKEPERQNELVESKVVEIASRLERKLEAAEEERRRVQFERDKALVSADDRRNRLEKLREDHARIREREMRANQQVASVSQEVRAARELNKTTSGELKLYRGLAATLWVVVVSGAAVTGWDAEMIGTLAQWRLLVATGAAAVGLAGAFAIFKRWRLAGVSVFFLLPNLWDAVRELLGR